MINFDLGAVPPLVPAAILHVSFLANSAMDN